MERHYALKLDLEETLDETVATSHLSLWGDTFEAQGRAVRNPADQSVPVIGEELAISRSLSDLAGQMMEAARAKIVDVNSVM